MSIPRDLMLLLSAHAVASLSPCPAAPPAMLNVPSAYTPTAGAGPGGRAQAGGGVAA